MAIKKTAKPIRPGQGQPGGPPNPNKMKISSALTVLGGVTGSFKDGTLRRKPLTNAQIKELKAIIAKAESAKMVPSPKAAKKEAKLIKDANKNSAKKAAKGAKFAEQNKWAGPARSTIVGYSTSTGRGGASGNIFGKIK